MGLAPGTLVAANATNQSLALAGPSSKGLTASEDLYRGADTLAYGDHKPSEDALDRVSSKINQEYVQQISWVSFKLTFSLGKKKRKAKDDSNEPVTYINERNKVFNKKVARYFDKYTKEYVLYVTRNGVDTDMQDSIKFRARNRIVVYHVSIILSTCTACMTEHKSPEYITSTLHVLLFASQPKVVTLRRTRYV